MSLYFTRDSTIVQAARPKHFGDLLCHVSVDLATVSATASHISTSSSSRQSLFFLFRHLVAGDDEALRFVVASEKAGKGRTKPHGVQAAAYHRLWSFLVVTVRGTYTYISAIRL